MLLVLAVIYIVFISLGLPDSLFGVVWPVVHIEFGMPESFASVYMIIVAVTSGGVSFFAGRLIRRFGTARVTFVSILLTAIGLVGISLAPNIFVMMFFAIVLGYGAGAIDTGLNNFVSLHYKARHMSWLHCFWGVGVTVSPLIMSHFLAQGSWRPGYRVVALMQLIIALCVLIVLKKWNETDKKRISITDSGNEVKGSVILKIKGIPQSVITLGLYCSMEFLIGTWGASFLVNSHACAPETAAKWVSLYYGGIMLGRFISGFISIKVNDKQLIRGGIFTSFAGIILLALPLGKISFFGLLLIGIGFGPIFPSILHSIPEKFGREMSPDITGFHMGGAYAIGFFSQLTFGYVATATSFDITPFVLIAFCAAIYLVNEATNRVLNLR